MVVETAPHAVLLVLALSLLISRIGAVAFEMTGLSPDIASFQARSALSGAGYTTDEAERVVATPGRRRIASTLILLGNVGIVSGIGAFVLTFTNGGGDLVTLAYLFGGSVVILGFARSRWLNRAVTPVIERALSHTTDLELRDYTRVLGLEGEYGVSEVDIQSGAWLTGGTLRELDLFSEGVQVLAIDKADGPYIGAPGPDTEIEAGDTVVLYGKEHRLQELSTRELGDDQAHEDAVDDHERHLEARDQRLE